MKGLFEYMAGSIIVLALIVIFVIFTPIITTFFDVKIQATVKEKMQEPCNLQVATNALMSIKHSNGMSCRDMIINDLRGLGDYNTEIEELLISTFPGKKAELEFGANIIYNGIIATGDYEEVEKIFIFPKKEIREVKLRLWFETID